jgi:hypothetical protein
VESGHSFPPENAVIPMRVDAEAEQNGLDLSHDCEQVYELDYPVPAALWPHVQCV